jgi:hypothetical protein
MEVTTGRRPPAVTRFRRVLASLVIIASTFGLFTAAAPAATDTPTDYASACQGASSPPGGFADAGLAADCLKAYGVALGKSDGSFGENDPLLRSQVSSLIVRFIQMAGVGLSGTRTFPDVTPDLVPDAQVRQEIGLLGGSGIIAGYTNGQFHPAASLTVAQAATLVVRAVAYVHRRKPSAPAYADQGSTEANYNYAGQQHLLNTGVIDNHGSPYDIDPNGITERGLLAEILAQGIQQLVDSRVVSPVGQGHRDGELGPGIQFGTFVVDGPNVVNVVTVDRSQGLEIRSTLATGDLTGRLPTSQISKRWHAAVAVNGDFFLGDGQPAHAFATGGRLLKAPANVEDSTGFNALDPRVAHFGTPAMAMVAEVQGTGVITAVDRFNDGDPAPGEIAMYTPEGAGASDPPAGSCSARITPTAPPQVDSKGAATQMHVVASTTCDPNPAAVGSDDLLVAVPDGTRAGFFKTLHPGQGIKIGWTLNPQWPNLLDSTGSNTTLVHNGSPSDDVVYGDGPFYETAGPRTAVGQLADGRAVLVTVDGRQPGYSIGMRPLEFAELLVSIGVVEAANLDGGGSSTLVVGGRVINQPSDAAGERAVGTALVVVAAGTPDPPPSSGTVGAPPPAPNAFAEAAATPETDPASLGGWAATLQMHGVPLRPELEAAARDFNRAQLPPDG